MKAVVYEEPFKVAVEDVSRPKIQHINDAIVLDRFMSSAKTPFRKVIIESAYTLAAGKMERST